jgi:hypothetical protein
VKTAFFGLQSRTIRRQNEFCKTELAGKADTRFLPITAFGSASGLDLATCPKSSQLPFSAEQTSFGFTP